MSTLYVDTIQNASGSTYRTDGAWVEYDMVQAAINADENISSLSDQGTGNPQFTLGFAMASASGAGYNDCGFYSNLLRAPSQSGLKINSTTTFETYCGSNTTTRNDWRLGNAAVFR